ncbi:MAG: carboxymuconolactone decarboxylase family protein [Chloroflexota bacterium]|nr:carboxymuconolactone decarboxylase family protein [Chloroflexota bacterium]MDE2893045.1 carboxymuconolactone decarboxylase family protein [Chloroflexota bacterium]
MARIDIAPGEGEESSRLFQARPELGAAMSALSRAVIEHSQLPVRERELVRMRIAEINQCSV